MDLVSYEDLRSWEVLAGRRKNRPDNGKAALVCARKAIYVRKSSVGRSLVTRKRNVKMLQGSQHVVHVTVILSSCLNLTFAETILS